MTSFVTLIGIIKGILELIQGGNVNKDKYIKCKSNEYALKLIGIFDCRFEVKLMEFIHTLLSEKELKTINAYLYEEMSIFAKSSKTVKVNVGRRRRKKRYQKDIDEDFLKDFGNDLGQSILDKYEWGAILERVYLNNKNVYFSFLERIKKGLQNNINKRIGKSPFYKNLVKIKDVFCLDLNEIDILAFLYLIGNDTDVKDVFEDKAIEMDELVKSIRLYCKFFEITPKRIRDYLSKESRLVKSGILEKSKRGVSVSEYVEAYLAGISRMDIIDNFFKEKLPQDSLPINDHIVPQENIESIVNLLKSKNGCNILLFGKPGTGKTEFTKSLASELNYPLFYINQYDEDGEENLSHRKSAIIAAQNILTKKSIIVIDECDPIINTNDGMWLCEEPKSKNDSKAWINSLLENTKQNIIWITNRTNSIDVSTKRRFSYSQEFKDLTTTQRKKVWENITQKHKVDYMNMTELTEMATKYKINAGGISLAVEDVSSMRSIRKKTDKKIMLENILKQHERFVFGNISKLISKSNSYDASILNTSVKPDEIFYKLKSFQSYIRENPIESEIKNMNLLFYGPPGTGKTELVKHLGEDLGTEVLLKRLSDIRSKWYGESLKNIASMFEEAEDANKILFIDEADSFFTDRESSSNENHLEETNELLTQMENFKGILICSTNMLESIDQAVLRRFTVKVEFDYLTEKGKIVLFRKYFFEDPTNKLNKIQTEKIQGINHLTPGDYKVVKHKYFFDKNISYDDLIDELSLEASLKKENKRKIGF